MLGGIVALAGLVTAIASLAWLHLQPTGLSPLRNPVSQYGITKYRIGYRVATIAQAVMGVALAIGIHDRFQGQHRSLIVVLLIVYAGARAVISWYPMDAPGATPSATGSAHRLLALLAFASVAYAAIRLGAALQDTAHWHSLAVVSTALGFAMVATLLGMSLSRSTPSIRARFGAVERLYYGLAFAWLGLFAVACVVGGGSG